MWPIHPSKSLRSCKSGSKRRVFRPRVDVLEDRLTPTPGLYIENFVSDLDLVQPGFDSWDADPTTLPPAPDELHIRNNITLLGPNGGFTATGGFAALRVSPGTSEANPYVLQLSRGFDILSPQVVFSFPNPGEPGGFALDEEVAVASVDVRFPGVVRFVGENSQTAFSVTDPADLNSWEQFSVTHNTLDSLGNPLGGIRQIIVETDSVMEVYRINVLVLGKETPSSVVIANDDYAVVSPGQLDPLVTFNWKQNDVHLDEHGEVDLEPLTLVGYTQPALGHVVMVDASGTATYRPLAGFQGRESFTYTIMDSLGNTDTAVVILDVNDAPVAADIIINAAHGASNPLSGGGAFFDANGDSVTVTLVDAPDRGFVSSITITGGRVEFQYETFTGRAIGPDRFTYYLTDVYGARSNVATVEIQVPNNRPEIVIPEGQTAAHQVLDKGISLMTSAGNQPTTTDFLFRDSDTGSVTFGDDEFPFSTLRSPDDFDVILALDVDGDALVPVLEGLPAHGFVDLRPDGTFTYTPNPLEVELTVEDLTAVRAQLLEQYPLQGAQIQYVFSTLGAYVGLEYPTTDRFFEAIALALTESELELFEPALRLYVHERQNIFGTDTFSYRVSDGFEASADVIHVTVRQSLGEGIARSDSFVTPVSEKYFSFYEGDDVLSGAIFTFDDFLENDSFDTGVDISRFVHAIQLVSSVRGVLDDGTNYSTGTFNTGFRSVNLNGELRTLGSDGIEGNAVIRPGQEFGVATQAAGTLEFDYRFLYEAPGFIPGEPGLNSNAATVLVRFTATPGSDRDGVDDAIEDGPLSDPMDGNVDGVVDSLQSDVASLPNAITGDYVTLESSQGTKLFKVSAMTPSVPLPEDVELPLGMFDFTVVGLAAEETATVTMYLPPGVQAASYWKLGPERDNESTEDDETNLERHWWAFSWDPISQTGAQFSGNQITLHFKDGARGDNDQEANGFIADPGGPVFVRPPTVERVRINDGSVQRSKINSITVTFSEVVALDAGVFQLRRIHAGLVPLKIAVATIDGRTVATLTFKGREIIGGSLANGRYRLTIRGARVHGAGGLALDGNGDGLPAGNAITEFFRLFGDADGDHDVDQSDRKRFDRAFKRKSTSPRYVWYFDFNGNGAVDSCDRGELRRQHGF
jgi:hypothetical protein